MEKTIEYAVVNNKVSPATVELLIRERSKGKSLRQLGRMFGRSHERIRKVLAKKDLPQVRLLHESRVAAELGYPARWIRRLRKEGIIRPIKPAGRWLYSEEQVRQIPSLITEARKCEQCGKPRPLHSHGLCRECRQYRKRQRDLAWQKANPERVKEILSRAHTKHQAKYFGEKG